MRRRPFKRLKIRFLRFLNFIDRYPAVTPLILAAIIGVGGGLGAIAFRELIFFFHKVFWEYGGNFLKIYSSYDFLVVLIPAFGGLVVGLIVYFFAREAKGHGVPEVMSAVNRKGGKIRPRVIFIKAIASSLCIASGGSVGREGPIVQIGSSWGSALGQFLRTPPTQLKVMVGCGAAAGIAATFNAPLAGAIFALEVILRNFAFTNFMPVIISSATAVFVSRAFLGNQIALNVPKYQLVSGWELVFYVILGLLAGVVAANFTRILDKAEDLFERWKKVPDYIKALVGGLVVGGVGLVLIKVFPIVGYQDNVFGVGYEVVESVLESKYTILILLSFVAAKIFATSITLGSGGSGGIFAPSLFVGAVLGGLVGQIVHQHFPMISAEPGAYAVVGMAAVVAGTTHAPFAAIFIIFEMTDDYLIIVPLMITTIISTMVARGVIRNSMYTLKLMKRGEKFDLGLDLSVLEKMTVGEVMRKKYESVKEDTHFNKIARLVLRRSLQSDFPVVNDKGYFQGMIKFEDVRPVLLEGGLDSLVVAKDIASEHRNYLLSNNNLVDAMNMFNNTDSDILPVLDQINRKLLIGILDRRDLMKKYHIRLLREMNNQA